MGTLAMDLGGVFDATGPTQILRWTPWWHPCMKRPFTLQASHSHLQTHATCGGHEIGFGTHMLCAKGSQPSSCDIAMTATTRLRSHSVVLKDYVGSEGWLGSISPVERLRTPASN